MHAYVAPADEDLINKTQTLPLFGRNHNLVQCLGTEWKNNKKWWAVMIAVRNVSQFIDNFDAKYFLEEWSAEGEGYNVEDNHKRFAGFQPLPEQFARGLGFLRGNACKSNYRLLRRLMFPIPPIMGPDCKTYFIDYEDIPNCPCTEKENRDKYLRNI